MQELKHWVPKKLHFPNTVGTEPGAKEHFELEHPHEGNGRGLFQCSYWNKGEQPKGWSHLCSSALWWVTTLREECGHVKCWDWDTWLGLLCHREHPLGLYGYSKLRMWAWYFWESLLASFVSLGVCLGSYLRILPVQWIYSYVHHFGTKTFLLGKGLVSI